MRDKRSLIRKTSSGSATIYWLDRRALARRVMRAAAALGAERREVRKVVFFGSANEERAVPGSDADLLITVSECDAPFIGRSVPYMDYFADIGVGVDLFVYTEAEAAADCIPLVNRALSSGRVLFSR